MDQFIDLIGAHYQWAFSGIGVLALTVLLGRWKSRRSLPLVSQRQRGGEVSRNAQVGVVHTADLIGTTVISDGNHQKQWGGFGSINLQANKVEFRQGGASDSAAPSIVPSISEATIIRNRLLDVISERMFELMGRHGIDLPTIAEILEVPLSMLGRADLRDRLDNPTLDRLANQFCVRREWLLGQSDFPLQREREWYKEPYSVIRRIIQLNEDNLKPRVYFLKPTQMDAKKVMEEDGLNHQVGIIIARTHKTLSGRTFDTFEPWEWGPWDYQKARLDFLAIVMFVYRLSTYHLEADVEKAGLDHRIGFRVGELRWCWQAISVDSDAIYKYRNGKLLPNELIAARKRHMGAWYPENFTERSAATAAREAELRFIEERYFEILKVLAGDIRSSRWGYENPER